ncbi:MAG: xanthine dehydrogenase family protein subunit M [Deltaproteobacteria bacterium]|nr:xanthine dehydrogenase family protein subunit M [Deltaproteobacteria bacterium]MBI2181436.1 xanthine dehydrogenase family protein subunit M [Deltaproteobacteria bacterium]MBI2229643.1 xanthine dehydrogenase family protein subunit M [Deltaproteobacteria bacterium]MBI2533601.1 xanthine dehydrogenase family protein subunit M [Deltaproteobacteria bacterium]MBI3065766.1 xanthine dehydrogenase family protein subunit M [Deltaproteobacteria bacterium]
MIPASFEYYAPRSLGEAVSYLASHRDDVKILSGGQSLMPLLKMRLSKPAYIVDIGRIPELDGIKEAGDQLIIGALVTHAQIEFSELLKRKCPLLPQTATTIADVQVRNRGTIGGSIAHADPAGDLPAAIMALDAEIQCTGPNGERWVKCSEFFLGLLMSVLEPDEIVTAIKVPATGADKTAYLKAAPRSSGFAVVGVAVRLALDAGGTCSRAAIGITGVTDKAYRAAHVEQTLTGKKLDAKLIEAAAAEATRNIDVIEDINGSGEYRTQLTHVYVARAIEAALRG